MPVRKDLVQFSYKMISQSTMLPEHSQRQRRITKIWKENAWQQYGVWKSSTTFLYGRHFVLQTDQKPLVSIFKKHMTDVTPRMQRLCIRTWNYTFTPEYLKGKSNVISDALSRVNPQEIDDCDIEKKILAVNIVTSSTLQQAEIEELQKATSKDTELQCLKNVISTGWPSTRSSCSDVLKNYWNYRDELWIEDGILMKNHKIVIPNVLKGKYLEKVHSGCQGINSCLQRAREYIFWNGYTNDIKETVEKCGLCQENASSTGIQYRYVSDIPPHPWHTLGSDLFYYRKQDFLVLVDYFSKFPVVRKLPNSTTEAVKKELHAIFLEFGIPFVLRSDNGPVMHQKISKHSCKNAKLSITHHLHTTPNQMD